jgi:hypothetical protein
MKTLAYHEGIPGHHFQISIALGLKDLPLIRQQTLYTAYAEGWALYAEQLAAEIGMYKDDPWGDLGRLQLELLRAARLVVDTGLHAEGWSREQAIDYMVSTTGSPASDMTSEVERYMAAPGQAAPTRWASSRSSRCARRRARRSEQDSISRISTRWFSRTAACRSRCSSSWWTSGLRVCAVRTEPLARQALHLFRSAIRS